MKQHLMRWIRAHPAVLWALRTARIRVLQCLPGAGRRPAATPAPFTWADARRGIAAPPDLILCDIPVVPAHRFHRDVLFDGGPVWPDFPHPATVRHMIHDQPADINATQPRRAGPRIEKPLIWGGRCLFHFGHLAAEHLNRLPGALYHQPDATAIFILPPGKLVRDVPNYFWDMMAWFGLPTDRVLFVTRPVVMAQLHVQPQTEHMSANPPPDWYLDLLDQLPRLHELAPVENRILYVHRCGQLAKGNGAHAGEVALVAALRRAGVAIMDPGQGTIAQQMALYAGARVLIFAEGSAIHGRQLLGRVDQTIVVLRRRPLSMMARAQLAPRCAELQFAPVVGGFAAPVHRNGTELLPNGISFLNLPALFRSFAHHGIDLAQHWDQTDYQAHMENDVRDWLRAMHMRSDIDRDTTLRSVIGLFARMGLTSGSVK